MKLANGLHDIERGEYDAISRTNFSLLKWFAVAPALYRYHQIQPREDTAAMKMGRVSHLAVFEPERFRSSVAMWDLGPRKGPDWEDFRRRNEGKELLTELEYKTAVAIGQAARGCRMAEPYLSGGRSEVTAVWTHVREPMGGLPGFQIECKGRVDFITNSGVIVDLKTCRDPSPGAFGRQAVDLLYREQASWYVDAVQAITGRRMPFKIVAVGNKPPHLVQVYDLTPQQLDFGRGEWWQWLERLHHCRTNNVWPAFSDGEMELALPRWAEPQDDEEDAAGLGLVIGE